MDTSKTGSRWAFYACASLTNVTIGNSVTNIGNDAFYNCLKLINVMIDKNISIALWFLPNPLILNNGTSLGVQTNKFGLTISWATNISVVVEACTNLAHPIWSPVQTNALTGGSSYFSDGVGGIIPAVITASARRNIVIVKQ
jgi:hypothetical protein